MADSKPIPIQAGFLGAGQMATALAVGWLHTGRIEAGTGIAGDPEPAARARFRAKTGIRESADNLEVVRNAKVLILAVKPQSMSGLLREIAPQITPDHLIVSIAAGITLRQIAEGLGAGCRIARVMPNTPSLIGECAAGISFSETCTAEDVRTVQDLFGSVGRAFVLPERLLDAVTGLSGSGPAFVYMVIEALSDGGVRMGLPREAATILAAQTVLGSAKMVLETAQHPGVLKDAVASPGGTTIAGIHALERGGLRAALMDAVEAATLRAAELGK